jgi:hypothetical protein
MSLLLLLIKPPSKLFCLAWRGGGDRLNKTNMVELQCYNLT